jgi:N-acetylmuramoyl-L-alanine amidase
MPEYRNSRRLSAGVAGLVTWLSTFGMLGGGTGAATHSRPPSSRTATVVAFRPRPAPVFRPWRGTRPHLYRIRWGDTLWALARRFDVSVADLEAANHLGDSSLIYAGDELVVPGRYEVQPGDTLRSVAARLKVPLVLLWHANRLTTDRLVPGQQLVIPYLGPMPREPYAAPPAPPRPLREELPSRGSPDVLAQYSAYDVLMLAHLVQAEAGNQPFVGMVAVAAVVLNRLHRPGFPKSIPAVITQPGQFASVANGTFWTAPGPLAVMAAKAALAGWDPTHGALYFYNPALTDNQWIRQLPVSAEIGAQVFCR